jgi:hypothetical protein
MKLELEDLLEHEEDEYGDEDKYYYSDYSEEEILAVKGNKSVVFPEGDDAKDDDVYTDPDTYKSQEESPDDEDPEAKELSSDDGEEKETPQVRQSETVKRKRLLK